MILLLIVGLWFFYQTSAIATRGGEDSPLYSAERHDPYGTAALFDLLSERGLPVALSRQPVPPHGTGMVLIRVLADKSVLMGDIPDPGNRMRAWMQEGNTVIEFTRFESDLMRSFGLNISNTVDQLDKIEAAEIAGKPLDEVPSTRQTALWKAIPAANGGAAPVAGGSLEMDSPATFAPAGATGSSWHALATDAENHWVAAVRPVGTGRLIIIGAPTPVLNRTLGDAANLEFITALLPPADASAKTTVWFDEWAHGLGREGTVIGFIRDMGLLPVIFQLIGVIALYVWGTSGYASAGSPASVRKRSSAEQIETLGHLYGLSLKPGIVFEKVVAEIRRRISGALRCPPSAIENELKRTDPATQARAARIFSELEQIGRAHGPTCDSCGYDLTHNTSGKCPECGAAIGWRTKERIIQTSEIAQVPERQKQNKKRIDQQLAAALRDSYQFVEEHTRVRNRKF